MCCGELVVRCDHLTRVPPAGALDLLDAVSTDAAELVLAHRIQNFDRFLLEHLSRVSGRCSTRDSAARFLLDLGT